MKVPMESATNSTQPFPKGDRFRIFVYIVEDKLTRSYIAEHTYCCRFSPLLIGVVSLH